MGRSVTIEIGDNEYELEVTHFSLATPARGWDPGDDGEIELGDQVKVWGLVEKQIGPGEFKAVPGVVDVISYDEFLKIYAESETIEDLDKADQKLHDHCYEDVVEQIANDFEEID